MKNLNMEKLNSHLEDMQEFLERFALSTKQTFNLFEEKFKQIDKRFKQVDQRFEQVDQRFEQVDQRFDRVEAAIAENKEAIYLNADTIAVMMQKMDAEFAAATLQRQRFLDRFDNHENRIVRLESHHSPA